MNREQAILRIRRGLGFVEDDSYDETIISALQEAQRLLENGRTLPHFLKVEDEELVVPVGSEEVALPDGFLHEVEGEGLHYVGDGNEFEFLEKTDLENLKQAFDADAAGAPRAYTIRKQTVAFAPPERDEERTLYWSYYKRSVSLASETSENEWLDEVNGNPDALIGKAGLIVATDLRDANAAAIFKAMYDEAWGGAIAQMIMREEANTSHYLGERL